MTGMPARDVSVLPVMNRNSVTGAAPVWSRAIARNGVMLMKVLTITKSTNVTLPKVQKACRKIQDFPADFFIYSVSISSIILFLQSR